MNLNVSDEPSTSSETEHNGEEGSAVVPNSDSMSAADKFINDLKSLTAEAEKAETKAATADVASGSESGLSAEKIRGCIEKQCQLELQAAKSDAGELIRQAEKSKVDILKPAGEIDKIDKPGMMDDEFFLQTSHVKPALVEKIEKGEFVDLVELLPHEKYIHNPDGRVHLVNKEGAPQFITITQKECPMINSLRRWETAFEIFVMIYTWKFPEKALELFQYKFNIKEAASVYIWDNIYHYDIAF